MIEQGREYADESTDPLTEGEAQSPELPGVSMVSAALRYAKRGWRVFPLVAGTKLPLRGSNGVLEATTDRQRITDWWDANPNANIGVACGEGLVVLDIDPKNGGDKSIEQIIEKFEVKDTPTVSTGRGGVHFYFSGDIRSRAGVLPGIDIRGSGGYIVAPPSVTEKPYIWTTKPKKVLPAWPFDFDRQNDPQASVVPLGSTIPSGLRNATLASLAGSMRRRGMTEEAIIAALLVENERCDPPLPEREVETIAKSIGSYTPTDAPSFEIMAKPATEFLAMDIPAPKWQIEGLWPEASIGFVSGPPKSFKSFYTLEMGYAIATGRAFLDKFPVTQGRCLLIQSESSMASFKERVRRTGLHYGDASDLYIITNRPLYLEDEADLDRLKHEVAILRPSTVILDPLRSFTKADENSNVAMGGMIRSLRGLRDEFGCSFVVVHHWTKTPPGNGDIRRQGEKLSGGGSLYAAAEVYIGIRRVSDDVHRSHTKYELKDGEGLEPFDVQFMPDTGCLRHISTTQLLGAALDGEEPNAWWLDKS